MPTLMSFRLMAVLMSMAISNTGLSTRASAQSSTACTITMVVNFAAGGGTDVVARVFAQGFAKQLGQQVIVENVPGGGAMLGTSRVAKSAPDGCQIAFGGTSDSVNQTLYRRPLYNL